MHINVSRQYHIEEKEANGNNEALIKDYREKVESELERICSDILTVIDEYLVPNAGTPEGRVFYFKMKGDYLQNDLMNDLKTRLGKAISQIKFYEQKIEKIQLQQEKNMEIQSHMNF